MLACLLSFLEAVQADAPFSIANFKWTISKEKKGKETEVNGAVGRDEFLELHVRFSFRGTRRRLNTWNKTLL